MMTIGDVLGFSGLLLGIGVCGWAIMTTIALLFPNRCMTSRASIEDSPIKTLLLGFALVIAFGVVSIAMLSAPNPVAKLLGWTLFTSLLTVAAIGAGGLAQLMAKRLQNLNSNLNDYTATCHGAALVFLCCLTPILGTFFLAPVALAMSVGAGVRAILAKETTSLQIS